MSAAEIAAGLTPTEARIIWFEGAWGRTPLGAQIMRPLVRRGLFERVERKGFQTRWTLTPLGLEVRNHLTKGTGDDR